MDNTQQRGICRKLEIGRVRTLRSIICASRTTVSPRSSRTDAADKTKVAMGMRHYRRNCLVENHSVGKCELAQRAPACGGRLDRCREKGYRRRLGLVAICRAPAQRPRSRQPAACPRARNFVGVGRAGSFALIYPSASNQLHSARKTESGRRLVSNSPETSWLRVRIERLALVNARRGRSDFAARGTTKGLRGGGNCLSVTDQWPPAKPMGPKTRTA